MKIFILFFIISIVIFYKSFSVYFVQDDFFIFSIARAANIREYLNFFVPRVDTTNYRPLCLQTQYLLFNHLFGLNPFPFHLLAIIIHALNGLLVYKLLRLFLKKTLPAVLAAFLFITSWTHFYSLNWVVCNCNGASLLFILLYFLTFLKLNTNKLFIPEIMLLGALFSNETAVVAPLLLFTILIYDKKINCAALARVALHFLLVAFYLYNRFILHAAPTVNTYTLEFSLKSLKNIWFFLLWMFNASEEMVLHLKFNGLFFTTDAWFFQQYPVYGSVICAFLTFSLWFFVYTLFRNRKVFSWRMLLFGAMWFFIAIIPVLIIPNRVYPYYPYLAQIGFWIILVHVPTSRFTLLNKFFLLLYMLTNFYTLWTTYQTHWLPQESRQTIYYMKKFQQLKLPKNAKNILIPINNKQARHGLMEGLAFNVFLNNYQINFYLEEKNVPRALRKQVYTIKIE